MKNTKTKLISSVTVLLICFAMLIGSTFAWFTDSASTGVNKIQAGNLDVQLLSYRFDETDDTYKYIDVNKDSNHPLSLFDVGAGDTANENSLETLWEPGKTQVAYLKIKNNGNLDLKYKVEVEVIDTDEDQNLYNALRYEIIQDANPTDGKVTSWSAPGTTVVIGNNATKYNDITLKKGVEHDFALAIHMNEDAGNTYKDGSAEFYIHVYATQLNSESDSFGHDYDVNAQYPEVANIRVTKNSEGNTTVGKTVTTATTVNVNGVQKPLATVTVPQGVKVDSENLVLKIEEVETPSNASVAVTADSKTLEIKLEGLNSANDQPIKVERYIGADLGNEVSLKHIKADGTIVAMTLVGSASQVTEDGQFYYDNSTGLLTLTSKSFSPFVLEYPKDPWSDYAVTVTPDQNGVINIDTEEKLAGLSNYFNSNAIDCDLTVNITKNIDLSKYIWSSTVLTIGSAKTVTINGNGNTISGLTTSSTINSSGFPCNGLISGINSVVHSTDSLGTLVVTNLNVNGANISSNTDDSCSAVIVGNVSNANFIAKDCTVTDAVVNSGSYSAGIVGYVQKNVDGLNVTLNNCKVLNSTIKGKHAASLVAFSNGEINISGGNINRNTLSSLKHSASALVGSAVKDVTATGVSVEENAYYREGTATCDIYNQKYGYIHIFEGASYTVDGYPVTTD